MDTRKEKTYAEARTGNGQTNYRDVTIHSRVREEAQYKKRMDTEKELALQEEPTREEHKQSVKIQFYEIQR